MTGRGPTAVSAPQRYHADMPKTAQTRIVLASQSPRRRRLLTWLGLPFEVDAIETPEELDSPLASDPPALATHLAAEKAIAVRDAGLAGDALVLCFDTIVVHDGRVLGKPADRREAHRMLRELSGRAHEVVTGCAMLCAGEPVPQTFAVTTPVRMRALDDEAIAAWMAQGTYLGCAGAYNIEAQMASVDTGECYQNVAGLPLCHVFAALRRLSGRGCPDLSPASPVRTCDETLGRTCLLGPRVTASARPR